MQITVTENPDPEDVAAITRNLVAFNDADYGPADRRQLAITVRNHSGELIGGISGSTSWSWLFVQLLWVDEGARGQGLAGQMLEAAETEARARGCTGAYIDTINPVALRAYQRAGYTECGRIERFTAGRDRIWLMKAF